MQFGHKSEVATTAMKNRSKSLIVIIAAICALGGFLAGSSHSHVNQTESPGEVGRYQLHRGRVNGDLGYVVFDTKTGHGWDMDVHQVEENGISVRWFRIPSPFDSEQTIR
jgi:hypothetical protein